MNKHRRSVVDVLEEIRQSQQRRGYLGRTEEEMQTEEALAREENDDYERRCEQACGIPTPPLAGRE